MEFVDNIESGKMIKKSLISILTEEMNITIMCA